jgi:uncharacterized membrane protein YkvI
MSTRSRLVVRALVPAMVFQSVITGGGFATGREVVEYFSRFGVYAPCAMGVACAGFALLFYITAEATRATKAYNYKSFGIVVLGRGWPLLEVAFLVMALLVAAVVIAAFSETARSIVPLPGAAGAGIALLITVVMIAIGRRAVITSKVIGAVVLTAGYAVIALASGVEQDSTIGEGLFVPTDVSWASHALLYVAYNSVVYLTVLYSLDDIHSKRESLYTSILAGTLMLLPLGAVWYSVALAGPGALSSPTPLHEAVRQLGGNGMLSLYYVTLFWTLLDTLIGITYAVVDRVEATSRHSRESSAMFRSLVVVVFFGAAVLLSKFGLVALVAKGYSTMAYAFLAVLVVPLLVQKVLRKA